MTRSNRIIAIGALTRLFSGLMQHAGALESSEPDWGERFRRVKYRSLEGSDERYSRRELELAVHAAASHRGASESYLRCVIDRESGWGVHADNPRSTAYGIVQFLRSTWVAVRQQYREKATKGVARHKGDGESGQPTAGDPGGSLAFSQRTLEPLGVVPMTIAQHALGHDTQLNDRDRAQRYISYSCERGECDRCKGGPRHSDVIDTTRPRCSHECHESGPR